MSYSIALSRRASKFLNKIDISAAITIHEKIQKLKENPFPSDAKFLTHMGKLRLCRIRHSFYRILYTIDDTEKIVLITKIDKRSRVY